MRQGEQAEAEVQGARMVAAEETGEKPRRARPKTLADVVRRVRRLTIRRAPMANRCFWVSAAELC
eukprot:11204097-Lingulodinium_polyedra.AAC.1